MKYAGKIISLITAISLILPARPGYCRDDSSIFLQGLSEARQGRLDFAFSYFDLIVRNYQSSPYHEKALFAAGEYYFISLAYKDCRDVFNAHLRKYPASDLRAFALSYLLRLAKRDGREETVKELEKELVKTRQVSLVFRDYKEYEVTSPLNKKYKAVFYIDKVEVFIDGDLFTEVPF